MASIRGLAELSDSRTLQERGYRRALERQRQQGQTTAPDSAISEDALDAGGYKKALNRQQQQAKRRSQLSLVTNTAKVAAELGGYGDLARDLGDFGESVDEQAGNDPSVAGKSGWAASKIAQRRGAGRASSAAVGGAVAGLLGGQNAGDIAKTALSWVILSFAFWYLAALFVEPLGAAIALIYLNFHFLLSKMGSKWFSKMSFWQAFKLAIADVSAFLLFTFGFVFILIIVGGITCYGDQPIFSAFSYYIFGSLPSCGV